MMMRVGLPRTELTEVYSGFNLITVLHDLRREIAIFLSPSGMIAGTNALLLSSLLDLSLLVFSRLRFVICLLGVHEPSGLRKFCVNLCID